MRPVPSAKKKRKRLSHDEFIRHADNIVIMDMCSDAIDEMSKAVDSLQVILRDDRLKTRLLDHEQGNLEVVLRQVRNGLSYARQRFNQRIKPQGTRSRKLRNADIDALQTELRIQRANEPSNGLW